MKRSSYFILLEFITEITRIMIFGIKILPHLVVLSILIARIHSHDLAISKSIYLESGNELVGLNVHETILSYVSCRSINKISRSCNLTVDNTMAFNGDKSCPMFLSGTHDWELGTYPEIFPLNRDKMIVVWSGENALCNIVKLKVFIIRLSNCEVRTISTFLKDTELNAVQTLERLLIIPRETTFEMIYENKETCQRACSEIISEEGTRLRGLVEWNITSISAKPGTFLSPLQYSKDIFEQDSCFLLKSGERLVPSLYFQQRIIRAIDTAVSELQRVKISTANGRLTLCIQKKVDRASLFCTRDDWNMSFKLSLNYEFEDFIIYNLPEGEILTMTSKRNRNKVEKSSISLALTAFDSQTRNHYSVGLVNELDCQDHLINLHAHIYEKGENECCVSLSKRIRPFHFSTNCFPIDLLVRGVKAYME